MGSEHLHLCCLIFKNHVSSLRFVLDEILLHVRQASRTRCNSRTTMAASFLQLTKRSLASEPKANTAPDTSVYSRDTCTAPVLFCFFSILFN
jgi:hypothetical protein